MNVEDSLRKQVDCLRNTVIDEVASQLREGYLDFDRLTGVAEAGVGTPKDGANPSEFGAAIHGGQVISASSGTIVMDVAAALQDNMTHCPKCKGNFAIKPDGAGARHQGRGPPTLLVRAYRDRYYGLRRTW